MFVRVCLSMRTEQPVEERRILPVSAAAAAARRLLPLRPEVDVDAREVAHPGLRVGRGWVESG